jgi:hypothetical protein
VYPNAYAKGVQVAQANLLFEVLTIFLQLHSGADCILHMVFPDQWKIKNRKNGVANELVNDAVFLPNRSRTPVVELVQQFIQLCRVYFL